MLFYFIHKMKKVMQSFIISYLLITYHHLYISNKYVIILIIYYYPIAFIALHYHHFITINLNFQIMKHFFQVIYFKY